MHNSAAPQTGSHPNTADPHCQALDWHRPWLAPYAQPLGEALQAALMQQTGIAAALTQVSQTYVQQPQSLTSKHAPIPRQTPTFVPQAALPKGHSYESFIRQHWAVPTREHLHDLFNGLIWLHWPRTKQQLNALQSSEIERLGVQGQRGRVRDACTLFDENGAILLAPAILHEALIAKDWLRLFWTKRSMWQQAQLLVFGHALLEQLDQPRKPLCAHVLTLPLPSNQHSSTAALDIAQLDACLAQALTADNMGHKPFTPMPVLGIPGWSPANAQRSFYEDASVFRPPRNKHLEHQH